MCARFVISADVCSASDADGSTILHVRKGMLFSAIGLASDLWTQFTTHPGGLNFDELHTQIAAEYPQVPKEQIECDIQRVLKQLTEKELVTECKRSKQTKLARVNVSRLLQPIASAFMSTLLTMHLFRIAALFQLFFFDLIQALGGFQLVYQTIKQWPVRKINRASVTLKLHEALNQAARYYPKNALCVQRSATLSCLLRSSGVAAETVIACRKVPFKGHAWVEVAGEVVNDKPNVQGFYNSVLTRC